MSCSRCGCNCDCPTQPNIVIPTVPADTSCLTSQLWEETDQNLVMPAIDSTLTLLVCDSSQYVEGMTVWIAGFGFFELTDIPDSTHITVTNTGNVQNAAGGTAIPQGTKFVAGMPEELTQAVATFLLSDFTTSAFNMPISGGNVNVPVTDTSWAVAGMLVYVQDAGFMVIITVVDSLTLELQNNGDGNNAAAATLIASNRYVYPTACCSGALPGPNTVSNAMLAKMAALTVKCNPTNGAADPTDLGGAAANEVLRVNSAGTALAFDGIPVTGLIALDGSKRAEIPDPSCVAGKFGPLKIGAQGYLTPKASGYPVYGPGARAVSVYYIFTTTGVGHKNGVNLHISGTGAFAGEEVLLDQKQIVGASGSESTTLYGLIPAGHYFRFTDNTAGGYVSPTELSCYYYDIG